MKEKDVKETKVVLDDYENCPVPEKECFGWYQQAAVWLGCGFCLAAFSLGGSLAEGLGFGNACLALLIGCVVLTLMSGLIGAIGANTHLSSSVTSRFTFGIGGAKIFGLICAVSLFGWFGYQCSFFGQSAVAVVEMAAGMTMNESLLTVIGGLAMMITAIVGYRGIKALSNFGVPMLFVLVIAAVIKTLTQVPFGDIVSAGPVGTPMNLGSGIVLVVGSFAVGASMIPDFSRYSKTVKDSNIGCFLGYGAGYFLIVLMGMIFTYAFGENNFTNILINKLGFGYIAAFVLIVATWTTNDNNLYQSVLGISNAVDGLVKVPRIGLTVVVGIISTAFGALGVVNIFVPFLSFLGVVIPPLAAVIIADYYFFNKDNYDFAKMDKQPLFNTNNCIASVAGMLVGCTMNSAPYGFQVPFMMDLATKVPSSIIAMLASVIACIIVNKVRPAKK